MNPTKVILGKNTLWSYVNVWTPKQIADNATPKNSISCIIKKDSPDVEKVRKAIKAAYDEGQAKLKGNGKTVPALENLKTPLRDGDAERPDDPAYKGCYFINANSLTAPGIVDVDVNPILDHSEVYSGCRGRVSVSFYCFNNSGNKGIAASLNNLQKISDDTPLGSKPTAASDFATDDDDDFLS